MSNGYVAVPGVNDAAEYEDTVEAMNVMGLPEEEQSGEHSTVTVEFFLRFRTNYFLACNVSTCAKSL